MTAFEKDAVTLMKNEMTISGSCIRKPMLIQMKRVDNNNNDNRSTTTTITNNDMVAMKSDGPQDHGGGKLSHTYAGEFLCECPVTKNKNAREWMKLTVNLQVQFTCV